MNQAFYKKLISKKHSVSNGKWAWIIESATIRAVSIYRWKTVPQNGKKA